jgi:hypothetical protein
MDGLFLFLIIGPTLVMTFLVEQSPNTLLVGILFCRMPFAQGKSIWLEDPLHRPALIITSRNALLPGHPPTHCNLSQEA